MGNSDNASTAATKQLVCKACNESIISKSTLAQTCCGHTFHRNCLGLSLKTRPFCPVCNTRIVNDPPVTPIATRSRTMASTSAQSGGQQPMDSTIPEENTGTDSSTLNSSVLEQMIVNQPTVSVNESFRDMIASIVSDQQAQLLSSLSSRISSLVETAIETRISGLNINVLPNSQQSSTTSQSNPLSTQTNNRSPPQMHTLPAVEQQTFRNLLGIGIESNASNTSFQPRPETGSSSGRPNPVLSGVSTLTNLDLRPDKVLQIISNWKIKFSGGINGLSVKLVYGSGAIT
ncbi:uncharacterized protein LOC124418880 [Lucilia cuprina]|uniref:uncharacterized protein LOC124418880 n=1 Tax=Lucilia cuprina TaxID=7375 RepID=UPI001F06F7B2|nr:uncharacterized protein LOC124418880 [Lucilia cuprina]